MSSTPDDTAPSLPPAPDPPDAGEPPVEGAPAPSAPSAPSEPSEPSEPPRLRLWERPGIRQTIWVVAVFLALLLIGVVFTPRYWRF